MNRITVSAPGKLMLLGEHAVVYGHPCLVTAVGQRMYVSISNVKSQISNVKKIRIDAPGEKIFGYEKPMEDIGKGEISKGVRFIEIAVRNFREKYPFDVGLTITTRSEFSSQFGFGSSSAAMVCTIKALAELFSIKLSKKQIFDLAYKTVLDIQGKGSGFDVAAAVYGGTLYFVTGWKKIQPLVVGHLPLVVGYSGVKADTVTLINQVAEKAKKYPDIVENIYKQIARIVDIAKIALVKKDWTMLGELMNINQGYLEALGVSTGKLSAMIYACRSEGAYGAKLSGAGGGDCIIALSPKENITKVKKAIKKVGGQVIDIEVNAEGVRME